MCPFEVKDLEVCEKMFRAGVREPENQHDVEGEEGNLKVCQIHSSQAEQAAQWNGWITIPVGI